MAARKKIIRLDERLIGQWAFRFLLRLSRIKRSQVMSMVKFGPTTLNFGYDFVLLVHLFCVLQFIYFAARIG